MCDLTCSHVTSARKDILARIHSVLVWAGAPEEPRQIAVTPRRRTNRKRMSGSITQAERFGARRFNDAVAHYFKL
jgi:hypothetical protein